MALICCKPSFEKLKVAIKYVLKDYLQICKEANLSVDSLTKFQVFKYILDLKENIQKKQQENQKLNEENMKLSQKSIA